MQNVTRKGYIEMLKEELDYYMGAVEGLKDNRKSLPDKEVVDRIIYCRTHQTLDNGIKFLALNAIRKHRGIPYPAF